MRRHENSGGKSRGRPRQYDPDAALDAALRAFWDCGFAGTSLEEIAAATGMNRPSLQAAFGDKKAIYRKAIARFNLRFLGTLEAALFAGGSLEEDLVGFYLATLPTYRSGENGALGCPVICTATIEAAVDDDIRADLTAALDRIDAILTARFEQARETGELAPSADPKTLGRLAGALLHSLAIRTRARQPDLEPEAFVRASVAAMLKA
jgi:TetR/AcrR family transcriptional regulator, copper-responsive repressor